MGDWAPLLTTVESDNETHLGFAMKWNLLALVLACAVLTGCASMQATKAPGTDLSKLKTFYVAKLAADERGIEKLISARLDTMGYQA